MAPSPAAGKSTGGVPKTPTKLQRGAGGKQTPQRAVQSASSRKPSTPKGIGAKKPDTDSPALPARPDVGGAAGKAKQAANDAQTTAEDTAEQAQSKVEMKDDEDDEDEEDGPLSKVQETGDDLQEAAPEPVADDDEDEDVVAGAKDTADDAAEEVEGEVDDADDNVTEKAGQTLESADETDEQSQQDSGLVGAGKKAAGKVTDAAKDTAEETKEDVEDAADDAQETAGEGVDVDEAQKVAGETTDEAADVGDQAGDAVNGVKDTAEETAEEATGQELPEMPEGLPIDLSVLKGLEVTEDGTVNDAEGNPIGRLAEGDAEDLAGYPIGDDGEILDDDGDLVGRVELLPEEIKKQLEEAREQGQELPEGADEYLSQLDGLRGDVEDEVDDYANGLPGLDILEGLTCQVDGLIYDDDGNTIGRVVEGDPEELKNATLNAEGEFIDEEGNVVGRAEIHDDAADLVEQGIYQPAGAAVDDAEEQVNGVAEEGEDAVDGVADEAADGVPIEDQLPGIEALEGHELNEAGEILDSDGNVLGGIEDGELKDKIEAGEIDTANLKIDEEGNVLDEEGNIVGKTELAPGAAEILANVPLADLRILDGKKINKKGKILDDDGEEIGELTDGELSDCVGKKVNAQGEVLDKSGNVVGHVKVVPGEASEEATKALLEELGELPEDVQEEVQDEVEDAVEEGLQEVPLSVLEGLKVNKKGQVLDEDGEPVGELTAGELSQCAGKKISANGEVLDAEGNVIGHVRTLPQQATGPALSVLEGLKVNKKGQVLNEDGEPVGELTSGDLAQCAGKKINAKGEVLDENDNVIGSVRTLPVEGEEEQVDGEAAEEEEDQDASLPPLSILEGLTVNKSGKIVDDDGAIVGELVEGDAKKLSKAGITADAEGQFWDNKGHVIGRAVTLPQETPDDEGAFAGLEGLRVVDDGWVQDENGNTVGYVSEGDAKALLGRSVDEDGDILDKKGSVVGRAERYTPEEEEETPAADLSFLQGKTVTKAGLVIGDEGIPVARLIEGSAKDLAGKQLDDQGQFWNDKGQVIGKIELIPEEERELKAEGPFAGLGDVHVIEGGKVADADGNVVGEIVDGNPRRLVGLRVDEDGDIVDKYGNVKGHAEPLPEEPEIDYSILEGLTLNKRGFLVDSDGVQFGRLTKGNATELAGRTSDENGYIYNDTGKVVGECEPIPEEERERRQEGPFAGLEGLRVVKDGKVEDADGNVVGEITEGDPKRLVGLAVDEDGDIIDKNGNTKGHAEPLPDEEEVPLDNSILNGKTLNKQGYVVDETGIPIGLLVEGNTSELAGRKCDENGIIYGDTGKPAGRCEVLPEDQRVSRPEGPFAGLEGLRVVKDGFVEDEDGNVVGQISEGNPKRLIGLHVDEDGDIIDKYGNVKGHAEPWEEEEAEAVDKSRLSGTTINKSGYAVDGSGSIIGQVVDGEISKMVGKKVDAEGQIWDNEGNVVGHADLVTGIDAQEGPFAGFEGLVINKDETITTPAGDIVGRVVEGDIKKLLGHTVDEDGDINDKNGNTIGRAERWEPEEKERRVNPMSGMRVNKEGEVRDENGDLIGRLTDGNLGYCVGQEIDDSGNVVDVDGNKIGEVTLLENIADDYEGPTEEELAEAAKREEERQIAEKMAGICQQTLERMQPICKQITDHIETADRTPKEELDEEELVNKVQPLIEEGGRVLQECNGSLRGLDPDGKIAAQAKGRAGTGEATPEEHRLAETLKELTTSVVTTIDNAKKKLNSMPHAKKKLNPLWGLLTQPLFQILAAVGLLLAGVLGLVGQLLNGLGLGGLVNGLLGGLGINKLLTAVGLKDDKKGGNKKGGKSALSSLPIVGGFLGGNK